jgi:hypothetical protein
MFRMATTLLYKDLCLCTLRPPSVAAGLHLHQPHMKVLGPLDRHIAAAELSSA